MTPVVPALTTEATTPLRRMRSTSSAATPCTSGAVKNGHELAMTATSVKPSAEATANVKPLSVSSNSGARQQHERACEHEHLRDDREQHARDERPLHGPAQLRGGQLVCDHEVHEPEHPAGHDCQEQDLDRLVLVDLDTRRGRAGTEPAAGAPRRASPAQRGESAARSSTTPTPMTSTSRNTWT